MNARFYDPNTNRFVTPDTIVPHPADSQSYNRFTYVRNNPVNFNDPSGHRECGLEDNDCNDPEEHEWQRPNTAQRALTLYCLTSALACHGDGIAYVTVDLGFMSAVTGYDPGIVILPYHTNPNYSSPDELFPWEGVADVAYSEHGQLHPNDPYFTDIRPWNASIRQRDRAYVADHWLGDGIGLMQTMINRVEQWGKFDTANEVALLSGKGQYHVPARSDSSVWADFYGVAFMVTELNVRVDQPYTFFAHQDLSDIRGVSGDRNGRIFNADGQVIRICCNETIGFGPTAGWKDYYVPIYHDPRF